MKIIAHRSGPTVYPEQTVASAKQALADGADLVEMDVRLTADGAVAVCHDDSAERVFGVDKLISQMTAAEFAALRHKDAPGFGAHMFRDYLTASVKPLLIHIKEPEVIPQMLAELAEFGYRDEDAVFGVTRVEQLEAIRAVRPNAQILGFIRNPSVIPDFKAAGANYIRLWEKWLPVEGHDYTFPTWLMLSKNDVGYTDPDLLDRYMAEPYDGILINDVREMVNRK